jgi:hypothetical protein
MSSPASNPDLITAIEAFLPTANLVFGTKASSWEEFVSAILPPQINTVRRLCVLYEREMLACRDGKAYFSACVTGASMIEALLLLLCMLNPSAVKSTKRYKKRAGKHMECFDQNIHCFGLDDFVEISAELNWISPSVVSDEWKKALPDAYREIAATRQPNLSKAARESHAHSLAANPGYSLMFLLNMMRNRLHAGKWIRNSYALESEDAFSEWAQVALVAAGHIRDCLIRQHQESLVAFCKEMMLERLKKRDQ